jgi:hypothetical protein
LDRRRCAQGSVLRGQGDIAAAFGETLHRTQDVTGWDIAGLAVGEEQLSGFVRSEYLTAGNKFGGARKIDGDVK